MTNTIEIIGETYTVAEDDKLKFVNQLGFNLQPGPEGEAAALVCGGRVTVINDQASGEAMGGRTNMLGNTPGSISLLDTSDIRIKSTGSDGLATGFTVTSSVSWSNAGNLRVIATDGNARAVLADSGAILHNLGVVSVQSTTYGTGLDGNGCQIENGGTVEAAGHVQSIGIANWDGGTTTNSGTISSYCDAGEAIGSVIGAETTMTSTGRIVATGLYARGIFFELGFNELHNDGDIVAKKTSIAKSVGLYINTLDGQLGVVTIDNTGLIRADMAIREAFIGGTAGSVEHVINSGQITGGIDLGGANDSLITTGFISGAVAMGYGDDMLDGAHGTIKGVITGDEGNDTLSGGKNADLIYGDRATATSGDGDDLISGGRGDDSLHGGGGADILIGGAGADILEGGDGADVFTFSHITESSVAHSDLIVDLTADDQIDLSQIDADVNVAGNQAFHLVGSLHGHASEAALSYNAGTGETTLLLDVDGDGSADGVVRMTGDHTDFTAFVL